MKKITKREYFTAKAMQALIANPNVNPDHVASLSVHYADIVLTELMMGPRRNDGETVIVVEIDGVANVDTILPSLISLTPLGTGGRVAVALKGKLAAALMNFFDKEARR